MLENVCWWIAICAIPFHGWRFTLLLHKSFFIFYFICALTPCTLASQKRMKLLVEFETACDILHLTVVVILPIHVRGSARCVFVCVCTSGRLSVHCSVLLSHWILHRSKCDGIKSHFANRFRQVVQPKSSNVKSHGVRAVNPAVEIIISNILFWRFVSLRALFMKSEAFVCLYTPRWAEWMQSAESDDDIISGLMAKQRLVVCLVHMELPLASTFVWT